MSDTSDAEDVSDVDDASDADDPSDANDLSDATDQGDADDSIAVWCAGEDWCPVTATANLLGKKWHPVVVHRLLDGGSMGFNELQTDVDGVSSKVLSDSLEDLEEKGLVNRDIVNEKPVRVSYSLTDRGESLQPVIEAMAEWGSEYLAAPADEGDAVS